MAPPVAPWITRNSTSICRFGARPHRNDAAVKPMTDAISRRLRPKYLASHPVSGRMIALATRYDVSTHVDSSMVAVSDPAMCGSDTFTTVVSSTSMKVANITAIATIQGLTVRGSDIGLQLRTSGSGAQARSLEPDAQFSIWCGPLLSPTIPASARDLGLRWARISI